MASHQRSHIVVIVLATAIIISVWLNVFFYFRGNTYYLQLNETRLDPLGLGAFESNKRNENSAKKIIVFFGDSRAAQWTAPSIDQFEFINRGIGAQTSAQVVQRFQYHVRPLHPQIIIVQVGINDLKTIPLFPERKTQIVVECKSNIKSIVEQSVQNGARVLLTTIFPLGHIPLERRLFWSDDVAQAIADVNQYILSLKSEHVDIFDTNPILAGADGLVNPTYSHDFLHLNAKGYEALNTELIKVLR